MWCIPPKHNAEFVYHMENVLEAYQRPYDPRYPLICMDELSKQLTIETQTPLRPREGDVSVSTMSTNAMERLTCSRSRSR